MKQILILLSLLVFENLQSQNLLPFYYKSKGVYKYVDSVTMKPAFNFEFPFWTPDNLYKGNIAIAIMKNSSNPNSFEYGIIDKKGNTIISGIKRWLFTDNLNDKRFLRISFQGKEGVLDTNGRIILAPIYDKIVNVRGNYIIVNKSNKRGILDSNGKQETGFIFDKINDVINDQYLLVEQNSKSGVYSFKQKKYIIPLLYDDLFYDEESKLYYAQLKEKIGCLDENGNIKLPFEFDKLGALGNNPTWYLKNNKVGYLNQDGRLITDPVFDYEVYFYKLPAFIHKMCVVIKNGKYGIINIDGTYLINPTYDYLKITDNANICFKKNSLYGIMNKNGKIIIPPLYSSLFESLGFYIFKNENSEYFGLLKDGLTSPIVDPEFIEIKPSTNMKVFFMRNETEARIFKVNNGSLTSNVYNELQELGFNYILAYKNSKWGVIDYNEKVILDFKYSRIVGMNQNYFICDNGDGKFFYVDKSGREFIDR